MRADKKQQDAAQKAQTMSLIALTAYVMEADRQHCLDAGMNEYLGKPVRDMELRAMLERFTLYRSTEDL